MASLSIVEPDREHSRDGFEHGPCDGDYVVVSPPSAPDYLARVGGGVVGSFPTEAEMVAWIEEDMERRQFWPNIWREGERGSIDLLEITPD